MKKVLIVTYYWPPGSGAGVQRWLKFSKYLPVYGWEPVILTINPDFAAYPAIDESLMKEIPEGLKVFKTKANDYFRFYSKNKSKIPSAGFANNEKENLSGRISKFIRGNFFIPDPRRGWNKYALRKACEIIENEKISHLITTSPPHSTQLIGLTLKKKYPLIRWIADLRDPWTDIYYYKQFYPTLLSERIDSWYEKKVLRSADNIVTVGNSLKDIFSSKLPGLKNKIEVVSNGYDEQDFEGITFSKPDIFTISYIGTLSDSYPLNGFLSALSVFKLNDGFLLRFAGSISPDQKANILKVVNENNVEFVKYVDHHKAINYMTGSSALLLIIPDHTSNKCIITGKLFEYLAAGKPVICLGPVDGDAAEIIEKTGHGKTFDYNDSDGISKYLGILVSDQGITEKVSHKIYSRENLVKKVIALLS